MKFIDVISRMPSKSSIADKILELSQKYYLPKSDEQKKYFLLQDRIRECNRYIELAKCDDCGTEYCTTANNCEYRFCPICAQKRSMKYLSILFPILKDKVSEGYYINMLTLTIKNTKSLKEGFDKLQESWRILSNNNDKYAGVFKAMFEGGVVAKETTYNMENETWHTHLHLIVLKKNYSRDYEMIKFLWERATQKAFDTKEKVGSVHITSVRDKHKKEITYFKDDESIRDGILETIKYMTKFYVKDKEGKPTSIFELYPDDKLMELMEDSERLRTISCFGNLRKFKKELENVRAEEKVKDLENKVCKICGCNKFTIYSEVIEKITGYEEFD